MKAIYYYYKTNAFDGIVVTNESRKKAFFPDQEEMTVEDVKKWYSEEKLYDWDDIERDYADKIVNFDFEDPVFEKIEKIVEVNTIR